MTFLIEGTVKGQGRPRYSTHGGFAHAYEKLSDKDNKALIRTKAVEAMRLDGYFSCFEPEDRGFSLKIETFLQIPQSWSKKRRAAAHDGQNPQKKPDLDNLAKAVLDALTGICYRDDTEVTELIVRRFWTAGTPYTKITITPNRVGKEEIK